MGAAVVAVIIRREQDAVEHFRRSGALSASAARSMNDLGVDESWIIDRMRSRGVIREGAPGLVYLDERTWETFTRRRRRRAMYVMIGVVVLGAVSAYYTWYVGQRR